MWDLDTMASKNKQCVINEFILKLTNAGLSDELMCEVIEAEKNKLAVQIVELIQNFQGNRRFVVAEKIRTTKTIESPYHIFSIKMGGVGNYLANFILFSKNGQEYYLPRKKKLFGVWEIGNCPLHQNNWDYDDKYYFVMDNTRRSYDEIVKEFMQDFPTPQHWLDYVNNS